jgi:hypothetical protein
MSFSCIVGCSFKFYTIDLVEIEPKSWFFLVFLILLNYVRLTFLGSVQSHDICWDYHHPDEEISADDDHRRRLGGSGDEDEPIFHTCPDYVMWYAIIVGYVLLLATLIVCIITHIQKSRLLRLAGVGCADDYVKKLKEFQDQENDENGINSKFEQMSIELASRIKSRQSLWKKVGSFSFGDNLAPVPTAEDVGAEERRMHSNRLSLRNLQKQDSIFMEKNFQEGLSLARRNCFDVDNMYYVSTLVVALGAVERKHMMHHQEFSHRVLFWLKSICSCFTWNCLTFRKSSDRPKINEKLLESARALRRSSLKKGESANLEQTASVSETSRSDCGTEIFEDGNLLEHPLLKTIDGIFLFSSRNIYKNFIQLILMLDSFYLSLYATNFISVSLESERPILFNVLILTTFLAMSVLVSYLLVVSSILFCVTSLHNKGTSWMCEQEEIKRKVLPLLRREMLLFLDNSNDVESFFSLISGDGDIKLSDFADFLFTLGIHPSQKEIRALFRAVDADASGAIDLDELKALLFEPNKAFGRSLDDTSMHSQSSNSKLHTVANFDSNNLAIAKQSEFSRGHSVRKALSGSTLDDDEGGDIALGEIV